MGGIGQRGAPDLKVQLLVRMRKEHVLLLRKVAGLGLFHQCMQGVTAHEFPQIAALRRFLGKPQQPCRRRIEAQNPVFLINRNVALQQVGQHGRLIGVVASLLCKLLLVLLQHRIDRMSNRGQLRGCWWGKPPL